MKKLIVSLISLTIIAGITVPVTNAVNNLLVLPCQKPVTYRIGSVDPRFNITKDQFAKDVHEASLLWNTASGKNILQYDPDGTITMQLVYDERQSLSYSISTLEHELDNDLTNLNIQSKQYLTLKADFDNRLDSFKKKTNTWNEKRSIAPDEYNNLRQEQTDLSNEQDQLNVIARQINEKTQEYNNRVDLLKANVSAFAATIRTKPEEGFFDPDKNEITVYLNNSHDELIHTLAHELGHALGLKHTQQPDSIMYPSASSAVVLSDWDKKALMLSCKNPAVLSGLLQLLRS